MSHRRVIVPGAELHVALAGPDDGPPIVLLHGFPETWWSWRHQFGPLVEAGHRVIAPDLRGYGASTRRGPFDLATLARDIEALLRALGAAPAVVVGHDWGGAIAWRLGAYHPDIVKKLVVIDCPLPHVLERQLARRPSREQMRRSWYIYFFQLPLLPEWLLGRRGAGNVIAVIRGNSVERRHQSAAELAPMREAARSFAARRAMLGVYRAAFRDALRRRLRPVEPPPVAAETLLVWGLDDPALGFDALVPGTERWAPRLRVEPLPGVGHFPQSERPDLVNPLLVDFARTS
ncbi:MAG: alpha/beta hydrolase [Deltaproteobacteria bacterium]|nr:alpha/beta hydrolase [Deltaproteobacteria bacterium]